MHRTVSTILAAIAALLGFCGASLAQSEQALAQENFAQADLDGDAALTLDEFRAFIDLNAEDELGRATLVRDLGRYASAFDHVDANADGFVTGEEIRAARQ